MPLCPKFATEPGGNWGAASTKSCTTHEQTLNIGSYVLALSMYLFGVMDCRMSKKNSLLNTLEEQISHDSVQCQEMQMLTSILQLQETR